MTFETVEVMRGRHAKGDLFGPLPGVLHGQVVAYEFELPPAYQPWPGRNLLERTFVLLDLGVSFANPCWARYRREDGTVVDRTDQGSDMWYVDLVSVEQHGGRFTFRDLYIDVMIPMDGRHYRLLDLDEFGDAIEDGVLTLPEAVDGLRRWQRFLDRHLHSSRAPVNAWTDFPPDAILPSSICPRLGLPCERKCHDDCP